MRKLILLPLLVGVLCGGELSSSDIQKLALKGKKIADALCTSELLPTSGSLEELSGKLKSSKACPKLSKSKHKALLYYLYSKHNLKPNRSQAKGPISVPMDAKCPVCGMFVHKYPKWAALIETEEKSYYFDGVKDMMKYYIFDGDFPYDRTKISLIEVNDYYTLEATPAKDAYFVYDADIYGPMGRELIPFATEKSAKTFKEDHHGKSIIRFDEITDKIVMALDG